MTARLTLRKAILVGIWFLWCSGCALFASGDEYQAQVDKIRVIRKRPPRSCEQVGMLKAKDEESSQSAAATVLSEAYENRVNLVRELTVDRYLDEGEIRYIYVGVGYRCPEIRDIVFDL